jgi:hypothetical protein
VGSAGSWQRSEARDLPRKAEGRKEVPRRGHWTSRVWGERRPVEDGADEAGVGLDVAGARIAERRSKLRALAAPPRNAWSTTPGGEAGPAEVDFRGEDAEVAASVGRDIKRAVRALSTLEEDWDNFLPR